MIKIYNNSKLTYQEIGQIIDNLNEDEGVTNYVGRHLYTDIAILDHKKKQRKCVKVDLITLKTGIKYYFKDIKDVPNKK